MARVKRVNMQLSPRSSTVKKHVARFQLEDITSDWFAYKNMKRMELATITTYFVQFPIPDFSVGSRA